ncbi:universal stress protein [uncultured Planococcus sp.]|uniref:universal stress protein n=1 Tax=uncultured Planococcus sp. TaxID=337815 RepID=UPI00262ACE6F|nr:universal stress protein [uncultured Planococcus sp.]
MDLTYRHLLVAIDGSEEAGLAFNKSIGIAKRNNAVLNLIYVVDPRTYTAIKVHGPNDDQESFKFGKDLLERYQTEALAAGVENVNAIVTPGSPKKVIARDFANKVEADLIVCGASGMDAMERFMLGSVSQHIVRRSPCDVLVVRIPDPEEVKAQV